jgi:hypothetical protein
MAQTPTYKTTAPIVNAGGISGSGNYSNVTLTGGAGVTYTTATGSSSWATGISANPWYTKQPKVNITDKDIELDGLSLRDFMAKVTEHMAIMIPNPKLEEEFNELKELADRYRKLEKKLLEQKEMWETLKKTDE